MCNQNEIALPLYILIDDCLSERRVPTNLKSAVIRSVLKQGNHALLKIIVQLLFCLQLIKLWSIFFGNICVKIKL